MKPTHKEALTLQMSFIKCHHQQCPLVGYLLSFHTLFSQQSKQTFFLWEIHLSLFSAIYSPGAHPVPELRVRP